MYQVITVSIFVNFLRVKNLYLPPPPPPKRNKTIWVRFLKLYNIASLNSCQQMFN